MFLFGFCFAVPFSTIVFCYAQLLITLKMVRQIYIYIYFNTRLLMSHQG